MTTTREVLERGYDLARQLLGPAAAPITTPIDFVIALQRMQATEERLEQARQKLLVLDALGTADAADFIAYDKVRSNVYAGTQRLVNPLKSWLRVNRPDVLARIPDPRMAPAVRPGDGRAAQAAGSTTTSGLGAAPAILAAGAWPVVGIILAVLAALLILAVIAYAIAVTAEMIRDSIVAETQTRALEGTFAERRHVYDDCRSSGGNATNCAQTAAQLAPTPRDAMPQVPPEGAGWGWIAWAAGALAVITIVGGGIYVYANERGGRGRATHLDGLPLRARRIRTRPSKRLRRDYDLDVE